MKSKKIYLDYASSAELGGANPSAIHTLGVAEKRKLESARAEVARVLGAHADEIIFTSGATEANNLAILGAIYPYPASPYSRGGRKEGAHIVTTNIEHASVLETCRHIGNATFVEVESNGIVDPKKIRAAIRPDTVLVSVMYANNEIGAIQPIREIAKEIRHYKKTRAQRLGPNAYPYFHTDAVQAANYLPLDVEKLGVDMLSLNGAKIYGPKGVGVLYKRRSVKLSPIMRGGDQEFGLRPGTENVKGAEAFARALTETEKIKEREAKRLTKLRDYFFAKLSRLNLDMQINGDLKDRLPNNVNITVPKTPSDLLVLELDARGIYASAKSACKAGDGKDSHVILAIRSKDGLPAEALPVRQAGLAEAGSIRFSMGRDTKKSDIDYTLKALSEILTKLKKWYS